MLPSSAARDSLFVFESWLTPRSGMQEIQLAGMRITGAEVAIAIFVSIRALQTTAR